MKIRFKFRTLLVLTAVIASYVALQLHITASANKFVEQMRNPSAETEQRLLEDTNSKVQLTYLWGPGDDERGQASLAPLSFTDVMLLRRRCEVTFATIYLLQDVRIERKYKHIYRLSYFGQACDSNFDYTSIDAVKRTL